MQVANHSFTSARGNHVAVFQVRGVARRADGWHGCTQVVRTFAVVCGVEVDMAPGCAFQAPAVVAAAGF